jgi:hypothetical protein
MTKRWLMAGLVGLAMLWLGPVAVGCAGPRLPNKAVGETVLTIRGQVKDGPYYLQRSDLAHLPRQGFRARPPGSAADARFDGVSLRKLLEYYLQPTEGGDTLVFVGKDGVAIPVTLGLILQYGPIVADQIDGQPVAPRLAWPNLDQRGLDADPRSELWWNGPLEALEVVAWARSWGRVLRLPPGASDEARLGAGQYGLRCAGCHKFHGVGGQRGPVLDGAAARLGPGGFATAMLRHPGWPARLGQELTSSEDVARQVAAFLAAADVTGIPPAEEFKPPTPPKPPPSHY